MSQDIEKMILAVLDSGEALLSEVIRDRINERFGRYFYQNYITKRLSFLMLRGVVESNYAVRDGKKMNYSEYHLKRITGVLSDPAEKRVTHQSEDVPAKFTPPRNWRQANIACSVCGGWYEVEIDGEWVCSKKHEQEGVV